MKLNALMAGLPAFSEAALVFSKENRFYLTGFASSEGCLFISPSKSVFFVDSRYFEAAEKAVDCCEVRLLENFQKQLSELFDQEKISKIALEAEKTSIFDLKKYKKHFKRKKFLTNSKLDDLLYSLRSKKEETELDKIKTAQAISEAAFEHILNFASIGKSEKEIALELDYFMLKNSAEALSFETIAVSGVNSSKPHGVPSDKKIESGDFLTLDFGAVYEGYH